jgi:hypothetical protein
VKSGSGVFLSFCSSSVKEEELPPLKLEEPAIENVNVLEALLEDYKKAYFLTGAAAIQFWLYNNNICTETLSKASQINFGFFANKICDTSTHFWHQQHLLRKEVNLFFTATFWKEEFLSNRLFLSTTHMQGTSQQLFMQTIASLQTQLFNSQVCM